MLGKPYKEVGKKAAYFLDLILRKKQFSSSYTIYLGFAEKLRSVRIGKGKNFRYFNPITLLPLLQEVH